MSVLNNNNIRRKILLIALLPILFLCNTIYGQTSTLNTTAVSGFTNNNGSGLVLFNFANNNPFSITITDVESIVSTAGATTAELWTRVNPLSGNAYSGGVTVASGWTLAATGTFTGIANTTAANLTTQPILTGISVTIPANTTYAMCIAAYNGTSGRLRYHTIVAPNIPVTTVTEGGCSILMGNGSAGTLTNTSFGAANVPSNTATVYNNPRAFLGKIIFVANNTPCTSPPTAGTATTTATNVCINTNFNLGLTGNTTGTGQTFQWQRSLNGVAPWTDISGGTNANFTISQTVTTWYRCAVTCGGDTRFSDSVQVTTPVPVSGTFTINNALPTGSGNFASFTEAVNYVQCGINGPVVFNVQPGSGPYVERITINQIGGTSVTNTVTFNGNGATLQFNSSTSETRTGIHLNGADYVTIDSLTIDGSAGTFAWGIVLSNQADSNIIRKCTINIGNLTNTTLTNHLGIAINGSATGTAVSGNNGNGNLFEANTINGGYHGIYLYGSSSSTTQNINNKVIKNIIRDNHNNGVYSIYQSAGLIIRGNDISRPTRSTSTTYGGVFLTTGTIGALVEKNRIYNLFGGFATSTSTSYGIYVAADATTTNPNRIENNAIYNVGGNGISYGIFNTGGDNMNAYHNTIVLNDNVATTGTAYGIYQTTAAVGINIRNNIVVVTRTGSGIKRCLHFNTSTSTVTSNRNVLWMQAAGGSDNQIGQWGTTSFATLGAWQGANSNSYDQQSISVDPLFVNAPAGDFLPTEAQVDDKGEPVGTLRDIVDTLRSTTTPDPGAWELPASAGIDMRPEALVSPAVSVPGCYNTETITVSIKNNGASVIDFSAHPVTVTVTVTGAVSNAYSTIVNTGTLASGASQNVTMSAPASTINMSAVGTYVFDVQTSVTGDVNPANDFINVQREKKVLTGGATVATPENYCTVGGMPALTAQNAEGYTSLNWQSSPNTGSAYTDIAGATTLNYTVTTPITQTTYYRLKAVCGTQEVFADVDSVVLISPTISSVVGATRCGSGTVNLTANTADPSLNINWYAGITGGTSIGTGSTFTTPLISATTTYYATASAGGTNSVLGLVDRVGSTTNSGFTDIGLMFDATTPFNLNSVAIYPVNSTPGTATINIALRNSAGTILQTYTGTVTTSASPGVKTVVPVNFQVPAGTGHRLVMNGATGLTGLIRESSTGYTYPYTVPGVASITSAYTSGASSAFYYYFYDWQISTGCEGPRTPVVATVTAPTSINVSATQNVICNGGSTTLNVSSTNSGYTYSWTPGPLSGASVSVTPTETTKYYVSATDAATSCNALDSVTITVQPTISSVVASIPSFCATGGVSVLSLDPSVGYAPNSIQWQTSSNNVTFTDIAGATQTTYTTPTINSTTYFRALAKNSAGAVCSQQDVTISLFNPQITSSTGATRCGPGTVTLSATAATPTSTINWYANPTGGTTIGTGNNFTTPLISSTTTYYAAANEGGSTLFTAMPAALSSATSGSGTTNFGLVFNALSSFILKSVVVYPVGSGAGTVTIDVIDGSGNVLHTRTVNVTGAAATATTGQRVILDFNILPGTNLKLRHGSRSTSITGLLFEPSASAPSGNYGYPYTIPGVLSINTSTLTAAPTNTARNDLYYYFYDWEVITGCEGTRTPVVATVTAPTPISVSATQNVICNGGSSNLNVTSTNNAYTYSWSPGSLTGSLVTVNPTATTKYYVNATDATTSCTALDSVTITVQPTITNIAASIPSFCVIGGSSTLSISPSTGYAPNSIQWQVSNNNVTFTDIAGANQATYTTPTISSTTYYRAQAKNSAGAVCSERDITVELNNPQILSTTPGTNCGTGTVNIGANGSAGSVINWYANATGGAPIATGNLFTTPTLNTTTTYYAAASIGGSTENMPSPTIGTGTFITTTAGWGLRFTVNQPVTINSVTVRASATTAGTANIQIRITDLSDVVVYTGTAHSFSIGTTLTDYVIPVNISGIVPGNYKMVMTYSGITNMVRESSGLTFPYTALSNAVSITAGANGTGTAQTTAAYYWFYNWVISTGCESARTAVVATIDNTPGCSTVPVSLVNFKGEKRGNMHLLSWSTLNEINNAGFELERSANGVNYSKLTFVNSLSATGNSNQTLHYSVNDSRFLVGNNYYRLKQIDKDGKVTFSQVVLLRVTKSGDIFISNIYPNPAKSLVYVQVENAYNQKVNVLITDIAGKVLVNTAQELVAGANQLSFNVNNFTKGTYVVKILCANGCETLATRFVKE